MCAGTFSIRDATWEQDAEALRSVRVPVFVLEQGVDPREEFDEVDLVCQHFLAVDAAGHAVGTARLDAKGKVGRMAVAAQWRKLGVGSAILQRVIERAKARGLKRIYLHAQVSALGFYERMGFAAFGQRFVEAGIEHLAMEKTL